MSALRAPNANNLLLDPGPVIPVVVYTGPTRTPAELAKLEAQIAAEPVKRKAKRKPVAEKPGEHKPARPEEHKAAKPVERKPAAEKADGKRTESRAAAPHPWTPMSSTALAASPPPALETSAAAGTPQLKPPAKPQAGRGGVSAIGDRVEPFSPQAATG